MEYRTILHNFVVTTLYFICSNWMWFYWKPLTGKYLGVKSFPRTDYELVMNINDMLLHDVVRKLYLKYVMRVFNMIPHLNDITYQ